jgi:LmbE family N-acetylglucosaminyl deacetylase
MSGSSHAQPPITHIYISPHLDDAVLSCGGRIWQQALSDARVLVVTVFAAAPAPSAPLSPFAQSLHRRWGHALDAALRRQEEDRAALALLGAEALHWPYFDCIYRTLPDGRFPYDSEESLWGPPHPLEAGLVTELAARLIALPNTPGGLLVGPLGVGHHVDHVLVRQALLEAGRPFLCYEDYPYAADQQAVKALLGSEGWSAERVSLSPQALEAKIAAIACYRSQISTFWGSLEEMAAQVRAFALAAGDGERPAERYWCLASPCPDAR